MAMNVEQDKCVGCGACVEQCPSDAIILINGKAHIDEAKCVCCGCCAAACPVVAINQD